MARRTDGSSYMFDSLAVLAEFAGAADYDHQGHLYATDAALLPGRCLDRGRLVRSDGQPAGDRHVERVRFSMRCSRRHYNLIQELSLTKLKVVRDHY